MNRRQFCARTGILALAGAAGLFQTACTPQPSASQQNIIEHPVAGQAFPVIVHHAYGSTRIARKPEQIVVMGVETEDIMLSLGSMPLAVEAQFWGGDDKGYTPWFKQAAAAAGMPLPETVSLYPEPDIEKLVALKPDLILAPQSGITPALYRQLSVLVPVIAHPGRKWLTPVSSLIDIAGAVLGKTNEAGRLKAQMQAQAAQYRRMHPEIAGRTFAYVYTNPRESVLVAYTSGEPRVDAMLALGLKLAPSVGSLPRKPDAFTAAIGLENADRLADVDILFTWFYNDDARQSTLANPLFASIPAVRRGSFVALSDRALATALYYNTPLSLEWALPRFTPMLLAAVAKLPQAKERP